MRDIEALRAGLAPLELDLAFAYRGLVDLVAEQVEKVDKTASGEEESRYAQATMRDLRANLQGCRDVYAIFRPWILSKRRGAEHDARVQAAFGRLVAAYADVPGDAMPAPPPTWSGAAPRPADLDTPFGRLFAVVKQECDARAEGSLHHELAQVARLLELPEALR